MLAKVRGRRAIRYLVVVRAGLETFIDLLQDVLHRYFTFGCLSVPLRAGRGKVCQEHSRCSRSSRAGAERSGNGTPAHVSKQTGPDCRVSTRIPFPRLERWLSGGSCALSGRGPWAACPGLPVLTMMVLLSVNLQIRWKEMRQGTLCFSLSARVPSARRRACHWRCLAAVSQRRRRRRPPQLQLLPPRLVLRLRESSHFVVASLAGWRALASQPRAPARSI